MYIYIYISEKLILQIYQNFTSTRFTNISEQPDLSHLPDLSIYQNHQIYYIYQIYQYIRTIRFITSTKSTNISELSDLSHLPNLPIYQNYQIYHIYQIYQYIRTIRLARGSFQVQKVKLSLQYCGQESTENQFNLFLPSSSATSHYRLYTTSDISNL